MAKVMASSQQDWKPVRPELTEGVEGQQLLDGPCKMVLTRVAPGGGFKPHRDSYGHLFYIMYGVGHFSVEGQVYPLSAGMSLQIDPGEVHDYRNQGKTELMLLSVNVPGR